MLDGHDRMHSPVHGGRPVLRSQRERRRRAAGEQIRAKMTLRKGAGGACQRWDTVRVSFLPIGPGISVWLNRRRESREVRGAARLLSADLDAAQTAIAAAVAHDDLWELRPSVLQLVSWPQAAPALAEALTEATWSSVMSALRAAWRLADQLGFDAGYSVIPDSADPDGSPRGREAAVEALNLIGLAVLELEREADWAEAGRKRPVDRIAEPFLRSTASADDSGRGADDRTCPTRIEPASSCAVSNRQTLRAGLLA